MMDYVPLVILCVAAFALATWIVSALIVTLLPILDHLAVHLGPRSRTRFYAALLLLPAAVASMALVACFLPMFGIGSDHCLSHVGHHLHLCMNHLEEAPGIALAALAMVSIYRLVVSGLEFARGVNSSARAVESLRSISVPSGAAWVFPSQGLCAFTLGVGWPRVFVSKSLYEQRSDVAQVVLGHVRIHQRRRDPLWRMLGRFFSFAHLPTLGWILLERFTTAQEMSADADAADGMSNGRLRMAEALLFMAKAGTPPAHALGFSSEDVSLRVRALLEDEPRHSPWWPRLLTAGALLLPLLIFSSHEEIHHGLETMLGLLTHADAPHP
jgi:hypothetical protein